MIPRPPRATRTDTLFPTRRSSDLDEGAKIAAQYDAVLEGRPGWSNRTSYVISPAGEIVHAYSESNPNRHVAETLAALDALEASRPALPRGACRRSARHGRTTLPKRAGHGPFAALLRTSRPVNGCSGIIS